MILILRKGGEYEGIWEEDKISSAKMMRMNKDDEEYIGEIKNAESLGVKQEQDLNVLRARLARIYVLMTSKKEKELEMLDNKFKGKKQELIGIQMRQINIFSHCFNNIYHLLII